MELEPSTFALKALLENSLIIVKEKALNHRIKLTAKIDGIPEIIIADERKLRQIIYNLLSNALKFTPDGGSVTLTARLKNGISGAKSNGSRPLSNSSEMQQTGDSGHLLISVEDNGIGIDAKNLERIFKPFEQANHSNNNAAPGTGLGLALTRELVELHEGKIWAESPGRNKGSRFTLVIPCQEVAV